MDASSIKACYDIPYEHRFVPMTCMINELFMKYNTPDYFN